METRPHFVNSLTVVVCFFICWGLLFYAAGRGFEFTDEAYYLAWASNPFRYTWSQSQFGFVWHATYLIVGGDIRLFRLAGAVVLSACALVFGCAIWLFLTPRLQPNFRFPFVLALVTAALWSFVFWIPTPSYNELNLCGLLLVYAGLIFATSIEKDSSGSFKTDFKVIVSAAVAALGVCVCLLAKPTTGLAAIAIGGIWIAVFRLERMILFTLVAIILAGSFVLAAIVMIDGSVIQYLHRNIAALRILNVLGANYGAADFWRGIIDPLIDIATDERSYGPVTAVLVVGVVWMLVLFSTNGRFAGFVHILALLVPIALGLIVGRWRTESFQYPVFYNSLIVPLALLIGFSLAFSVRLLWSREADWRRCAVMAGLLAMAPFCYSIGTNTRLIYHASQGAVFWFASMFVLVGLAPSANRGSLLTAVKATSACLTVGMLLGALTNPYRLDTSIWEQTALVNVGTRASPLLVDQTTADYIVTLQQAARMHGFEFGTPIIDLTGESPGTAFALGAEAPGGPWLAGGYAGSTAAAREILGRAPRDELHRAWVLTAVQKTGLPESTLDPFGLDFPYSYDEVGRARFVRNGEHVLWKPKLPAVRPNP